MVLSNLFRFIKHFNLSHKKLMTLRYHVIMSHHQYSYRITIYLYKQHHMDSGLHLMAPASCPDFHIKTTSHSTCDYKHVLISNVTAFKSPCLSMGTETRRELSLLAPHCTESMCFYPGNSFNILPCSVSNLVLDWRHHSSVVFTESGCQWGRRSIHWPVGSGGSAAFIVSACRASGYWGGLHTLMFPHSFFCLYTIMDFYFKI